MIAAGTAADIELCSRDQALRELEAIEALGAVLLAGCEPAYPSALREIADPPPVLTVLGQVGSLGRPGRGHRRRAQCQRQWLPVRQGAGIRAGRQRR